MDVLVPQTHACNINTSIVIVVVIVTITIIIIITITIIITTTTTTYAALMYDGVVVTSTGCDAMMVRATGACAVTCDV